MSKPITLFNSTIEIADNQFDILPSCTQLLPQTFLDANQYSRYLLCCLATMQQNNLILYKVPKLLKIYRGDPFYNVPDSKPLGKMSFYFNAEDASSNGFVHEFIFIKDINVLAMDRISNIQILLALAIQEKKYDVVSALEANFIINRDSKKQSIIYNPNQLNNFKVLDYLCSIGYDGFAFKPLGHYRAQIYLCFAHECFLKGIRSPYDGQFVEKIE